MLHTLHMFVWWNLSRHETYMIHVLALLYLTLPSRWSIQIICTKACYECIQLWTLWEIWWTCNKLFTGTNKFSCNFACKDFFSNKETVYLNVLGPFMKKLNKKQCGEWLGYHKSTSSPWHPLTLTVEIIVKVTLIHMLWLPQKSTLMLTIQDPRWIEDQHLVIAPFLGELSNMEEQQIECGGKIINRIWI